MPDLEEVLGDYFRLLPTRMEEKEVRRLTKSEMRQDPQLKVWQDFCLGVGQKAG